MKIIENVISRIKNKERVIARFGDAILITNEYGRLELRGGTKTDVAEAIEWISLFMHEATPILNQKCD